jgi:hypothetical protein
MGGRKVKKRKRDKHKEFVEGALEIEREDASRTDSTICLVFAMLVFALALVILYLSIYHN